MSVDDELSKTLGEELEVSDDLGSEDEIQNGGSAQNVNKDANMATATDLPPLKAGALATLFQEDAAKMITKEWGKQVNPHLARTVNVDIFACINSANLLKSTISLVFKFTNFGVIH